MTLEQLLALLPDNNTGAIDADDLRTIVTELYTDIAANAQQLTVLTADVADVAADVGGVRADLTTTQAALDSLEATVATLGGAVSTLQTDVGELEDDVATLQLGANTLDQAFSCVWTTSAGPAVGKVTADAWSMAATKIQLNETTDDGQVLSFAVLDNAVSKEIRLLTADGKRLRATINGPTVDQGSFRDIFVTVHEVLGAAPVTNQRVTVAVIMGMDA